MTAKDKFLSIGYRLWEGNNSTILLYQKEIGEKISIRFNLLEKTISIFSYPDNDVYEQEIILDIKEIEAIQLQIKELNW